MHLEMPGQLAFKRVWQAQRKGYAQLKKEHIADVKPLYERLSLSLGGGERNRIPMDERINAVAAGGTNPDLSRLMFQYGRYLLIASSREDSPLPTHMGGIWNDDIYNNIDCTQDMHVDMNLQMQYWDAAQCGLAECYAPFFKYLENVLVPSGQKTAREVYGAISENELTERAEFLNMDLEADGYMPCCIRLFKMEEERNAQLPGRVSLFPPSGAI